MQGKHDLIVDEDEIQVWTRRKENNGVLTFIIRLQMNNGNMEPCGTSRRSWPAAAKREKIIIY